MLRNLISFIKVNKYEYFRRMKLIIIIWLIISVVFVSTSYLINSVIIWEVVQVYFTYSIYGLFIFAIFNLLHIKHK